MRLTVGLGLGALGGSRKPCASLIWYDFVFIRYLGEGRVQTNIGRIWNGRNAICVNYHFGFCGGYLYLW